ncbi:MAG: ECF-type riboflavin transporter substrate-binding protein [Clostridiales bacterium]|uniref:UPF0397 protein EDD78_107171 n=1 Tax=Harryflintia acetispora TaxID=1849041 RepID=A0A9X8Y7Y9_9FIRM|nr:MULTISPECIES: ECF-type riboflavin transporter substrate-binding protein [Oscillospiraceae]PWM39536.1 MAG: ECF-type riboflavin transporter substrate-binding protein [Clostridiales bacterium]RGB64062.1 ECF-type riboflavin transporter substrate-binding protein [Harryflintia acetispora]TCL43067.1 energy-coupling factor transport system substrate-specific component [Harryflintia acetispora]
MNKKFSIKTVVAIGIGAAVFVVLGRFAAIPTPIPNTTINTQYAFLAVMAMLFGPLAGALIAFIGHLLIDLTAYGSPWMSWIFASGVAGLLMGLFMKKIDVSNGEFGKKEIITFNVAQVIAHAVAWILVAPALDVVIYAEVASKVFTQGIVAFIANVITTGVIGTILAVAYAKTRTKKGSLDKE